MNRFWDRCFRFVQTRWSWRRKFRISLAKELPDNVKKYTLYAIGEDSPWLAALQCPCGCGDVIQLSLLEDESPRWSLRREKDGTATLSPSHWRRKGCRSHFFLKRGVILWCVTKHRLINLDHLK
jgi:Family of unknown function (DUF6527)